MHQSSNSTQISPQDSLLLKLPLELIHTHLRDTIANMGGISIKQTISIINNSKKTS